MMGRNKYDGTSFAIGLEISSGKQAIVNVILIDTQNPFRLVKVMLSLSCTPIHLTPIPFSAIPLSPKRYHATKEIQIGIIER